MKKTILLSVFLLCNALFSFGQWPTSDLSEAKKNMGTAVLGTRVYYAGGNNGTNSLSTVEVYNIATGTCSVAGNLSNAREIISGVSCGSKVLFAGGMDWSTNYATVDIFDTVTQLWTVEQLSVPRFSMAAVSHGTRVMFAGGIQIFTNNWSSLVNIFDIQTGGWSTTNLSQPREGIAAVVVGDRALFAGGFGFGMTTNRVDIYNFATNTWSKDSLSLARGFASATTVGNKVIIAGGITSLNNTTNRVDIYDALTGTWDTASLSFPRASQGNAATCNGKAYFAGGGVFMGSGYYSPSDVIDIYNPANDTWTVTSLNEPLLEHSVAGVGNFILVAGGKNGQGNFVSTIEILDFVGGIAPSSKDNTLFRVHPNPSSGNIRLDLPKENHQKPITATVYNLQGQVVFSQIIETANPGLNMNLADGIYLLKVISGTAAHTELIAIQN